MILPTFFGSSPKNHYSFAFAVAAMASLLTVVACTKNRAEPEPVSSVQLRTDAALGSILTDKDGRTLYYFANDPDANSTCTGGCAAVWPAFDAGAISAAILDPALDPADFGSIATTSGNQTTYRGRPLYYYAPSNGTTNVPEAAGQTGGENVNGVWFVAKPDYTIMFTNAQLIGHDGKLYLSDYTEGTGKTKYFTDGNGVTLYSFFRDSFENNNFTAADFSNDAVWPIFQEENLVLPSSVDAADFSVIDVFGKKQLTYKGWPLYYFGQDSMKAGLNKGISFPRPAAWPVVNTTVTVAPAP